MITVKINNEQETVTYSTHIVVDDKQVLLSITTLLYYAKPYHLDHNISAPKDVKETLFEQLFFYPEECYTEPKLNHIAYFRMTEPNSGYLNRDKNFKPYFYQSGKNYELQWKIVS